MHASTRTGKSAYVYAQWLAIATSVTAIQSFLQIVADSSDAASTTPRAY